MERRNSFIWMCLIELNKYRNLMKKKIGLAMSGFYPVLISISLGIQRVLLTVIAAESVYKKSLVVVLLTDFYLTTCDKRCQLQVSYNNDIRVLKFMKSTIFQLPVCLFSFLAELHNVYLLSGERFTQLKPLPFVISVPSIWSSWAKMATILEWSIAQTIFCTANTSYWMGCQ